MKIGEIIAAIEADGWYQARTKGSHRQFKHPSKAGCVAIAGKPSDDVASGTLNSILKQAGLKVKWWSEGAQLMRYAVVIEKADRNFSAYVPDLPGCIATAATAEEVEQLIREAVQFHIEGLREDGPPVPAAQSKTAYVEA